MVVLSTERLLLRHLQPEDLEPLYALYRDPEIRKYYPDGTRTHQETKEELEWFLHGHPRRPELGLWATVERNSGEFLGRCGLLPWHIQGTDEVELAFMIKKGAGAKGLPPRQHTASSSMPVKLLVCVALCASSCPATRRQRR